MKFGWLRICISAEFSLNSINFTDNSVKFGCKIRIQRAPTFEPPPNSKQYAPTAIAHTETKSNQTKPNQTAAFRSPQPDQNQAAPPEPAARQPSTRRTTARSLPLLPQSRPARGRSQIPSPVVGLRPWHRSRGRPTPNPRPPRACFAEIRRQRQGWGTSTWRW
jgi:hypothetical protein